MRWLLPLLLPTAVLTAGCNNCNNPSTTTDAAPSPPEAAIAVTADAAKPRKTPTGGATAMTTLSTNVDAMLANKPSDPVERRKLVDQLLLRAEIMGRPSDLLKADELTKSWPDEHYARAKVLAATHKFEAATAELNSPIGVTKEVANQLRYEILIAHGEYDEALAMQPSPIDRADANAVAHAAILAFKMTKKDESRKLMALAMQKAEDDGAPLPYAWLCFQQGLLHERAGDTLGAEAWFGSALGMVPQYALAAAHLSAVQQPDVALQKLGELAKTSDDPAVLAARAAVFERQKKTEDAKTSNLAAAAAYDALVAKLPERFSDPAARFYEATGNPAKALGLARSNAKYHPAEDAMALWLTTAASAKDAAEACAASRGMKELSYSSDRGRALATEKCPDAGVR